MNKMSFAFQVFIVVLCAIKFWKRKSREGQKRKSSSDDLSGCVKGRVESGELEIFYIYDNADKVTASKKKTLSSCPSAASTQVQATVLTHPRNPPGKQLRYRLL